MSQELQPIKGHGWLWVLGISMILLAVIVVSIKWGGTYANNVKNQKDIAASTSVPSPVPSSGIFIIPPGGKEVNRDTTGKRVAYYNVGDKIIVNVTSYPFPEALYYVDAKTDPIRIRIRGVALKAIGSNKAGIHIGFKNFGTKNVELKAKVIPRQK